MKRRTFLKRSLLATPALYGAGIPEVLSQSGGAEPHAAKKATLQGRGLRLEYDLGAGTVSLYGVDRESLLLKATAAVITPSGIVRTSDANYQRRASRIESTDAGMEGETLLIECTDQKHALNLDHRITLLRDRTAAVFELLFSNVSAKEMLVREAEPLRASLDEKSGCFFSVTGLGVGAGKVLTNGFMCYDPGELIDFNIMGGRDFTSWWNAAFYAGSQTLLVGYLENREASGQIIGRVDRARSWIPGSAGIDLFARSYYNRSYVLPAGRSASSGRVLFQIDANPFNALETYADSYARLHSVKLNPIVNGWCSWFYTRRVATEEEQLRNAEFAAKHFKPYGMEWIQVDAGYQRAFGDWDANEQYPHGMKWLARKIRELGFKAGIWCAPFEISEGTWVARNHPEWLGRHEDGEILRWKDDYASWIKGDHYALDITHPGAREWLSDLFRRIAEDWGYDMIKIDRMEPTLLAIGRYHDPAVSKAQAYRLGMETIRQAIGPHRHLLDCGPVQNCVGISDSARIEEDGPPLNWRQYAGRPNSVAPAAAHRYYFHKRTWINDDDHLGIAQMPIAQGRAAATLVAFTGGTTILGDRLIQLDAARLDILKKVMPSFGVAARPLDLFEKAYPEIFMLKIERSFGHWWVVGCFNWNEEGRAVRDLALSRLAADSQKAYLAYDFWEQKVLGSYARSIPLVLEPSSVCLMAIREALDRPQVVSTTRHFTQGGVELENVNWDSASLTLSGVANGEADTRWDLAVHVPPGYVWEGKGAAFFQWKDSDHVLAVAYQDDPSVIRATLDFSGSPGRAWSFRFRRA